MILRSFPRKLLKLFDLTSLPADFSRYFLKSKEPDFQASKVETSRGRIGLARKKPTNFIAFFRSSKLSNAFVRDVRRLYCLIKKIKFRTKNARKSTKYSYARPVRVRIIVLPKFFGSHSNEHPKNLFPQTPVVSYTTYVRAL